MLFQKFLKISDEINSFKADMKGRTNKSKNLPNDFQSNQNINKILEIVNESQSTYLL